MKISIITASYNSARTIGDTLESVKNQTYTPIEHLIVDGASTDDTLDIIKQYPHVASVLSEKDKGIYDAMNKGISRTSGEVIAILNSDDIYISNAVISTVMRAFTEDGADAVYGDLQYVHPENLNKIIRTWKSGSFSKKKFYFGWMPPHPAFFVRREIYDQVGHFNTSLRSAADYELMLRILLKNNYKVLYIPEVLVKMRTGGMSNATLKHRIRANREDRQAWLLNDLKPYFFTIPFKPLRKIFQYINR